MTEYDDNQRGTGRTTKQMEAAPQGAWFIWCNGHLDYPNMLARKIGRADLHIDGPSFFDSHRWRGLRNPVIIDHALDIFTFPPWWRARYFEVRDYLDNRPA